MRAATHDRMHATLASTLPTPEERLRPTHCPWGMPAGYQEWRRLLFLHWPVPVEALRPHVPEPLAIDTYDGQAYLGLIPFFVQAARPIGAPRSLGIHFLETNVRTYVHLDGKDPGVYFFSLDAASLMAVFGARLGLGLPYFHARMAEQVQGNLVDYRAERSTGRGGRLRLRYEVGAPLGSAAPNTLEHFLVERYLLHARRGPTLWTVQIHHQPYPLRKARVLDLADSLIACDGLPEPEMALPLVHYAAGVDVEIFPPRILPAVPGVRG